MDENGLPAVDLDKCTACGDCVDICPRHLFSLHPVSHRLWVACMSQAHGEQAEEECEVACTGCGLCAMDAAPDLIRIEKNLAVVDYNRNQLADPAAIQRCPTGAIVWFTKDGRTVKGAGAKKIVRKKALRIG
jgi:ferredoxin